MSNHWKSHPISPASQAPVAVHHLKAQLGYQVALAWLADWVMQNQLSLWHWTSLVYHSLDYFHSFARYRTGWLGLWYRTIMFYAVSYP